MKGGLSGGASIESKPKKTRQGSGQHTKYGATSRNAQKKSTEDRVEDEVLAL